MYELTKGTYPNSQWLSQLVLVLLCTLMGGHISAQELQYHTKELRRQDSLRTLLQTRPYLDTVRVNQLNALGIAVRTTSVAEASQLFESALKLARQLHYLKGTADAQFGIGYYYRGMNAYDSAFIYTQQAIKSYTQLGDDYNKARGLYNLSRIYYEQGNYNQALAFNLEGLALTQARHNRKGELFQLNQLGLTNTVLGEYAIAQQHLLQALAIAQSLHDAIGIGHACSGLGDWNRAQARWTMAGVFYEKAAASYRQVYNAFGMITPELNLAEMTERQGNYAAALVTTTGLLRRTLNGGSPGQVARAQLLLARTFLAMGQLDSAIYYGARSLVTTRHNGRKQEAHDAADVLAQASAKLGNWAEAYRYQRLMEAYTDSLTGEAIRRQTAILQFTYERSQQQSQIRLLKQLAKLQAQQQELARLRYRQQVTALAAIVMLIVLLSGALLWNYRRREASRVEALRTRIAADLHDEVGSMLTQIAMQSTLLRENRYAPAQQQTYLDQMSEASRRAARQMSDAVWSIDARYDSASSLLDRLRDHAHEVLPPAGLELDFMADTTLEVVAMPLATRQALYFIYKEALHNIVKHAHAQQVWVRVRLLGKLLELEVRDDGQGLSDTGRSSGQGLNNMRMRAVAIGGTIIIDTKGTGMSIVARLPLR